MNPVGHLLSSRGVLATLPPRSQQILTGNQFFPSLIGGPFHHGLLVVFAVATALAALAAVASLLRGGRYIHPETAAEQAGEPEESTNASRERLTTK